MKSLSQSNYPTLVRFLSGIGALAILIGGAYLGKLGLMVLSWAIVVIATRELMRLLVEPTASLGRKLLFFVACQLGFFISAFPGLFSFQLFALIFVIGSCFRILEVTKTESLGEEINFIAKLTLGIMYMGLLPGCAVRLISLHEGILWFFGLLGVVFFGDIFAFFAGKAFGKNLLKPSISPKKTVEGAVGGLIGSLIAAGLLQYQMPDTSYWVVLLGFFAGVFGQFGDFYESSLKRFVGRKDSGSIMPGHGGILDRIDGVLFAAPLFMLGASLLESGVIG